MKLRDKLALHQHVKDLVSVGSLWANGNLGWRLVVLRVGMMHDPDEQMMETVIFREDAAPAEKHYFYMDNMNDLDDWTKYWDRLA